MVAYEIENMLKNLVDWLLCVQHMKVNISDCCYLLVVTYKSITSPFVILAEKACMSEYYMSWNGMFEQMIDLCYS